MSHINNAEEQYLLSAFPDRLPEPELDQITMNTMELYPEITEQSDVQNNQMTQQCEFSQENDIVKDPTLSQINCRNDFDDDEKIYEDLSRPHFAKDSISLPLNDFDDCMNWDYEQSSHFINLNSAEVPINRIEIVPSYQSPYLSEENSYLDSNLSSYMSSPKSSYCASPLPKIEDYFNNNTNEHPRSRKPSICSKVKRISICDKSLKEVKKEKPFRSRKTKAQMESMSENEKKERKKEQNRNNAKACTARKTGKKNKLAEGLLLLKDNLETINRENEKQKNRIIQTYKDVIYQNDNNSPYGDPQNLKYFINSETSKISFQLDKDNKIELDELEKEWNYCDKVFDDIKNRKTTAIKANTYASQKSRAKTALEIADLQYKTSLLEVDIQKGEQVGEALCRYADNLNRHLMHFGLHMLPVEMEYNRVKKTEPR